MSGRVVVVTGMHRSGTSLLARLINLLGVHLGNPEDIPPGAFDNPKGFWETLPISRLDEAVLEALGGSWDDPPELPPGWVSRPELDRLRDEARAIVQSRFAGRELSGWKDPRASLTLPFWRTVLPVHDTILCVRDPREVAASLHARNDLPEEHAARLWLRYTCAAWLADSEHLLVRYDDVFTDIDTVLDKLAERLGVGAVDGDTRQKARDFFDSSLRHHRAERPPGTPLMELAVALHDVIVSSSAGTVAGLVAAGLAAVSRDDLVLPATVGCRGHVEDTVALTDTEAELARARQDAENVQAAYERLMSRRSVRAALGAAAFAKPFFRLARSGPTD